MMSVLLLRFKFEPMFVVFPKVEKVENLMLNPAYGSCILWYTGFGFFRDAYVEPVPKLQNLSTFATKITATVQVRQAFTQSQEI